MGIDALNGMYEEYEEFREVYVVCDQFKDAFHNECSNFLPQDVFLFKGAQLCVPKCSMRTNLINEKHFGRLGGNFNLIRHWNS